MPVTKEQLQDLIGYEPETGLFRWKVRRNAAGGPVLPGTVAGTPKDGYTQIIIGQRSYRAHRLAWLFMTGAFPERGLEIDHINRERSDNRWSNLRLVSRSQNNMNGGLRSDNKSGARGVGQRKDTGAWYARIKCGGQLKLLGHFATKDLALAARRAAEERFFGNFAPKQDHSHG